MSPPPRRATPTPTLPPDEQLELTEKRLGWFKGILGAGVAMAALGAAAALWDAKHATKDDVEVVQKVQASAVDELAGQVTLLRDRVTRTEAALDYISRAVYEVAQKTGATSVPPPPSPAAAAPAP